jgi:hypothetical protein
VSPFTPDTPFNYAPILVQDGAASFSLLPIPLVYFAFCLPLVASLMMGRMAWAAFYGLLTVLLAFVSFPSCLMIFGALLLLSLPAFVATLWGKDDIRFNKTLPLATCVAVFVMVPLGFPRMVGLQMDKCIENRMKINEAAQLYLKEQPDGVLEVKALVPSLLPEMLGCQGPGTSAYILNATDTEVLVTCDNPAHQRENLGPARSTYPRTASTPPAGDKPEQQAPPTEEGSSDQP